MKMRKICKNIKLKVERAWYDQPERRLRGDMIIIKYLKGGHIDNDMEVFFVAPEE